MNVRSFSEMQDEGLLWLINRVVFHPRGFALAFQKEDDGTVSGWTLLGDGREVWTFTNEDDDDCFLRAVRFFDEHTAAAAHTESVQEATRDGN